ncbi:hypothetical protein [Ideonella sp. BN130291]|uniref:hypothetical protein n=1 Tax=Ideonella sp. BN130291 TaxID=3112940 RepID=UPI002E267AD6|nr:hypothetical protein [Ideonella sp. BN130291]
MAVLRLELDIDSDVYPELYAQLVFITRSAARGERVRQLAATGLVWETVRIHGFAAAQLPAVPGVPAPLSPAVVASPPPAPAVKPAAAKPVPAPRSTPRAAPKPARAAAARPPAPAAAASADFVDLGISAMPPEALPPLVPPNELAAAAAQLPVLVDVVDTSMGHSGGPIPTLMEQAPLHDGDEAVHAREEADAGTAGLGGMAHRSAPRSRLIRMKERGLFKNG